MSYGSPSQWQRRAEVDTTVPENPIHEKLTRLKETVEQLNKEDEWNTILSLIQSVVDQIIDLRKEGWQGRIDLWLNPGVLKQKLFDVFGKPEMGEVNVHWNPREMKIPNMQIFNTDIKKILQGPWFPPIKP